MRTEITDADFELANSYKYTISLHCVDDAGNLTAVKHTADDLDGLAVMIQCLSTQAALDGNDLHITITPHKGCSQ